MGSCCETARNSEATKQNLAQKESTSSATREKQRLKATKDSPRTPMITDESFQQIENDTISLIYRRESESLECEFLYSTIYQATHVTSETRVLIREIRKTVVRKRLPVEDFFEGIRLQRDLDHQNIAKVFDLYQDEHYYYLIYEDIRGNFLSEYFSENRYLSEVETALIGKRVASVLQFLHTKGVVNGLICPGNLIFGLNGKFDTIKMLDFSFAAKHRIDGSRLVNILPNKYRAPEILENKDYDKRSEIWAFGVLLYSLLHGEARTPRSENEFSFQENRENLKFPFKSSLDISTNMKIVILSCVAANPQKRPKIEQLTTHSALKKKPLKSRQSLFSDFRLNQCKGKVDQSLVSLIINRVISLQEKEEYTRLFDFFDTNNDEYFKVRNDPIAAQKEVDQLFRSLSPDPSHQITYTEFLSVVMDRHSILSRQNVCAAFKLLDVNGSGYLTKEKFFTKLSPDSDSEEDWNGLLELTDSKSTQKISLSKFEGFFCKNYRKRTL